MAQRNRVRRALALALLAGGLVGAGSTSPAHAESIHVTWPDVTALNPAETPYDVGVQYDGPGYLFLVGLDWANGNSGTGPMPLPREGTTRAAFPDLVASDDYFLVVAECPTSAWDYDDCRAMEFGPHLHVYNTFSFRLAAPSTAGPSRAVTLDELQPLPTAPYDVDWEVFGSTSDPAPILTGRAEDVAVDGGIPVSDPDNVLTTGATYTLRFDMVGEAAPYGHLERRSHATIRWDSVNEARMVTRTSLTGTYQPTEVFYPFEDGLGDYLEISLGGEDLRSREVTVENKAGRVVYHAILRAGTSGSWNGRDAGGDLLPEGRYKVIGRSVDWADNVGMQETSIRLSHQHLAVETKKELVTAGSALLSEHAGSCGSVTHPAIPDWTGAVGLHTDDSCPRGGGWFAHAAFRFSAPTAVVFVGQPTVVLRRQRVPGTDGPDLDLRTRQPDPSPAPWSPWLHTWTLRPAVLGADSRNPRFLVSVAAFDGSSFDLRDFRITTTYVAVVE